VCKGLVFFLNYQIIRENILMFFFSEPDLKITPYIRSFSDQQTFSVFQFSISLFLPKASCLRSDRECKGAGFFSYFQTLKQFYFKIFLSKTAVLKQLTPFCFPLPLLVRECKGQHCFSFLQYLKQNIFRCFSGAE
jgi:hypothetical protein